MAWLSIDGVPWCQLQISIEEFQRLASMIEDWPKCNGHPDQVRMSATIVRRYLNPTRRVEVVDGPCPTLAAWDVRVPLVLTEVTIVTTQRHV